MIKAYKNDGSADVILPDPSFAGFPETIVWLDLVNPSREEELFVEEALGLPLPTRDELKDIEPSSRLYVEDGALYMMAPLIYRADTDLPLLTDVAFILHNDRLITVRYAEPKAFNLFIAALTRGHGRHTSGTVLACRLLEAVVDRTAEVLETLAGRLDNLSLTVFVDRKAAKRRSPRFLEGKLIDIAAHHQLVSKVRDSLVSLSRLVAFMRAQPLLRSDQEAAELCGLLLGDLQSLAEHAAFIANNITFMLDASLGLISLEQNAIIKIFSIASVVFLPPTLVASVYGMNFRFMPELDWHLGYPLALFVMLVSAVLPFLFFRWKGWL